MYAGQGEGSVVGGADEYPDMSRMTHGIAGWIDSLRVIWKRQKETSAEEGIVAIPYEKLYGPWRYAGEGGHWEGWGLPQTQAV